MTIDEAFPRGKPGGSTKERKKRLSISKPTPKRKSDLVDDLFKPQRQQKTKKNGKKSEENKDTKENADREVPMAASASASTEIEKLTCSILQDTDMLPGMLILGCICEIHDYRMSVSLPGGIQADVPISDISDGYSQKLQQFAADPENSEQPPELGSLFRIGQLVQCKVSDATTRQVKRRHRAGKSGEMNTKQFEMLQKNVTINPRNVNAELGITSLVRGMVIAGAIIDVEEKGYTVDLGLGKSIRAFIRFSDSTSFEEQCNEGKKLAPYQIWPFVVEKADNNFVSLKIEPAFKKMKFDAMPLRCVTPGLVLPFDVFEQQRNGLILQETSGNIRSTEEEPQYACAHSRHLPAAVESYKIGRSIVATVLYVHPLTKTIQVSLLKHVRRIQVVESSLIERGTFFDSASVLHVEGKKTVVFSVSSADQTEHLHFNRALAPISHLGDKRMEVIDQEMFGLGTTHRCRVIGISLIDGCYRVTLRPSILDNSFYSLSTMKVGDKAHVTIDEIVPEGLRVSIDQAKYIGGFLPWVHASESTHGSKESMEMLYKRFPVGSKLRVRVFNLDPSRHRLIFTARKGFLKTKNPILRNVSDAQPKETKINAIITKIVHAGITVAYYSGIFAFAPRKLLPPHCRSVSDLGSIFHVGQIVEFVVAEITDKQYLILSMPGDTSAQPDELSQFKETSSKQKPFQVGQVVNNVKLMNTLASAFQVKINDHFTATLPFDHLSDWPENCKVLRQLEPGFIFEKLVVVSNRKQTIVSRKQLLIHAAESNDTRFVKSAEDMQNSTIHFGWVVSVTDFGVFVGFPDSSVGLAPKKFLTDRFVASHGHLFSIGQTVLAKVVQASDEKVNKNHQKMIISLKVRDVMDESKETNQYREPPPERNGCRLLQTFFDEQCLIVSKYTDLAAKFPIGSVVSMDVSAVADEAVTGNLTENNYTDISLRIPQEQIPPSFKSQTHSSMPTVGQQIDVIVLYYNYNESVVEVSANPRLVSNAKTKLEKPALPVLPGQTIPSEVQLVRAGIVGVCSLAEHATGRSAVVPVRRHINDVLEPFRYVQGQSNDVKVKESSNPVKAVLTCHKDQKISHKTALRHSSEEGIKSSIILPSGSLVEAEITGITSTVLSLKIEGGKFRGRVHISEAALDKELATPGVAPFKDFLKGHTIKVRILGLHHRAQTRQVRAKMFECSLVLEKPDHRQYPALNESDSMEGVKTPIYIKQYRNQYAIVEFSRLISRPARIHRLNMSKDNNVLAVVEDKFPPGTSLGEAEIIRTSPHVEFSVVGQVKCIEVNTVNPAILLKKSAAIGLNVSFADGSDGNVALTDINDTFVSFPTKKVSPNSVIPAYILSKAFDNSWVVSTRTSRTEKGNKAENITDREIDTFEDLIVGDVLKGYVVACKEKSGVFIRLGRNVVGRATFENASDYYLMYPERFFLPGLAVTVKVLSIDSVKQIEVSLLKRDTNVELPIPKDLKKGKRKDATKRSRTESTGSLKDEPVVEKKAMIDEEDENEDPEPCSFDFSQVDIVRPPLAVEDFEENEDEEMGEEDASSKKETAREKEARTFALEMARLRGVDDPEAAEPQSVEDFDRLVMEKPNSSLVWSKYIAFHLAQLDVVKARQVAERALKAASFREESERLNVWVAYMNVENLFGNEESLREIVRRASQEADAYQVRERLVDVLVQAEKFENAEQELMLMSKKFREYPQVWLRLGKFMFDRKKPESARNALNKALDTLHARHHVDLIVKFALLEMECGDSERGKTLFERVVANYPKRLDVWNVYIDALLKKGRDDIDGARRLLERMVALKLPYSKARTVFRRFANFEKSHGNSESIAHVEELAQQYLEKEKS